MTIPCQKSRCFSPVACGGFGYCRELNFSDETGPGVVFHTFNNFASISVDGVPQGYLEHRNGETRVHLGATAPDWLRKVRAGGPWISHAAAQNAIKEACQ